MGPTPRKHHTVPEFYLHGFAHHVRRKRPRVWVLDVHERKWRRQNPKQVARETDFYTVDAPPLAPNAVETDVLARYENVIAPVLRDLERRAVTALEKYGPHPFAAADLLVEQLARFVAMMHVRSSPIRANQRVLADQLGRRLLDSFAPNEDEFERRKVEALAAGLDVRKLPYEAVRRAIDGNDFKFDLAQTFHVGTMLGGWQTLSRAFLEKHCSLLVAGGAAGLLVASDNPVGSYWNGPSVEIDVSKVDPRLPNSGAVLPISPRVAIVFDPKLRPIVRRMTPREVAVTNSAVALGGDRRLVFALGQTFPWYYPERGISRSVEGFLDAADALRGEVDRVNAEFTRGKVDELMERVSKKVSGSDL